MPKSCPARSTITSLLPVQRFASCPRNRKGVDRAAWKIKPSGYADDEIVIQQWDEILRMIATHQAQGGDGFGLVPPAQRLLEAARPLSGAEGVWTDSEITVYPSGDRRSGAAAGHREADGSDRACAPLHAGRLSGNPREFLQAEKEDQEMAEACKRLIKNCIICWNYLYLSQKLEEITDTESREALLDAVAHGSTVAWRHLNLLGEYDFSEEKLRDSVGIRLPKLTP